jgi:hypothetical protein
MIGLASAYILYDTSNVLHRYRTEQYVAAALPCSRRSLCCSGGFCG